MYPRFLANIFIIGESEVLRFIIDLNPERESGQSLSTFFMSIFLRRFL